MIANALVDGDKFKHSRKKPLLKGLSEKKSDDQVVSLLLQCLTLASIVLEGQN